MLDHYPAKASAAAPIAPPPSPPKSAATPPPRAAAPPPPSAAGPDAPVGATAGEGAPPKGLITLERPFDVDEFSQLLGETMIRVTVPKEDLGEVLRRITDFMGFGIYVYSFQVRPSADESLRRFLVELRRVDFSPSKGDWVAFEETGRSDSPFGPGARA